MQKEQPANESVVAVLPTVEKEETAVEVQMKGEVSELELFAKSIVVSSQEDYEKASEFGRQIKAKSKDIVAFFEPIKKAAHQAHVTICNRESDMLKPLVNAEKIVKKVMSNFVLEQERRAREEEERLRKLAQEEADRKLKEAIEQEEKGNVEGARVALSDAEMIDNLSGNITVKAPKVESAGTSYTKTWEIESIDESLVPINVNGVCVRPVSQKDVLALIKAAKGKISIPGVKFKESLVMAFRK